MNGEVIAVCISTKTGEKKRAVDSITLIEDYGVKGDAHGGTERQVSLLAEESVDKMRLSLPTLKEGDFAENILTRNIDIVSLPIGTKLRVGQAEIEITQIGKKCHRGCEIRRQVGKCIMPEEGVFAKVLRPGDILPGAEINPSID